MSAQNLQAAMDHVFEVEGGFVNHPQDPGGATNLGITRRTLANWRGVHPYWDLPIDEVRSLQSSEAIAIYAAKYWHKCRCDELPSGIDIAVFDYAVNSGPHRAITALQKLVGAQVDGVVGPKTLAKTSQAMKKLNPNKLVNTFMDQRLQFLRALKTFSTFGRGWSRRVASVRAFALSKISATSKPNNQENSHMDFLSGYKTYIVALAMLSAGLAQFFGVDLPGFESQAALQLVSEALAIIFLRKGVAVATAA